MTIRFHWRLPQASDVEPGIALIDAQTRVAQSAEAYGIDSLLVNFGASTPDPLLVAAAIGMKTRTIRFLITARSGVMAPAMFVQQINTLSSLIGGRVSLNFAAGHSPAEQRIYGDYHGHDERYARTGEFLAVARALWNGGPVDFEGAHYRVEKARVATPFGAPGTRPEICIAGNSPAAGALAMAQGDCWMLMIEPPHLLRGRIDALLAAGKTIGLRLCTIVRRTRREALEAAEALVAGAASTTEMETKFVRQSDSVSFPARFAMAGEQWLTPVLWSGAVRTHGPAAIALAGTPDEVAAAIDEYAELGVSQFLVCGWPRLDEMPFFCEEVLPRVSAMRGVACV